MDQQLQIANAHDDPNAVRKLLESLKGILDKEEIDKQLDGMLMGTSPFYAGGTHLAWCAAEGKRQQVNSSAERDERKLAYQVGIL